MRVVRDAVSREEGRRLELKKKGIHRKIWISMRQRFLVGETRCDNDFEAVKGSEVCHYNRRLGVPGGRRHGCAFRDHTWIPCTGMGEGALMYQIFVDRFNGDPTNDVLGTSMSTSDSR